MIKIDIESIITRLKNKNQTLFNKYKRFSSYGLSCTGSTEAFYSNLASSTLPSSLTSKQTKKMQKKYSSSSNTWKEIKNLFLEEVLKEISFCPYCGKVPLISFEKNNKKLRTFDLDHFFPKSEPKYSHLSVNFYNLVPACKGCNQIKSNSFPKSGLVFHPYFGWIDVLSFAISSTYIDFNTEYTFGDHIVGLANHVRDHIGFFNLSKIYGNSRCTSTDFKHMVNINNRAKDYALKLKSIPKNELLSELSKEFVPEKNSDILKYSNGKFRKDILNKILKLL